MADKHVTNTTTGQLGLPGGPTIMGGATVLVKDWDKKSSGDVVKAWLDTGALKVQSKEAADKEREARAKQEAEAARAAVVAAGPADANRFSATETAKTSALGPIGATAEEMGQRTSATPSGPGAQSTDANDPAKTDMSKVGDRGKAKK